MNIIYGESVYDKFHEDGRVREYPGCSIVSMLDHDSELFAHCMYAAYRFKQLKLAGNFIMLPPSSYHMTVLQGFNDQVRMSSHWSKYMPLHASLEEMDDFMKSRFAEIPPFPAVEMKLDRIQINDNDFRILLTPASDEDNSRLRTYRDQASDKFGIRLPNHEEYVFHITIAYVWKRLSAAELGELNQYITDMDGQLQKIRESFLIPKAELTFYNDMFRFPTTRIREEKVWGKR